MPESIGQKPDWYWSSLAGNGFTVIKAAWHVIVQMACRSPDQSDVAAGQGAAAG